MTTIPTGTVSNDLLTTMNGTKSTGTQSTADAAQDRFMTLLVTQMKNQDPLNPLDNAQVTSQLAQLSTVTGIDKLNTTLQALQSSYQSSQSLSAASMIGHSVLVPGASTSLASGQALFGVELASAADKVQVTVTNQNGQVVRSMDIGAQDAGAQTLKWDGTTDSGAAAPDGTYNFTVAASVGGTKVSATPLSFGIVNSVATGAQGVKLNIPGGGSVNLSDVRQIL
ncbi:flagellar basal-body rod modification protein FlgD [Noviherbaspirillum humi]|uniref:Basal-body rod modification protein FlgD n=1 Tax=Noviherbaspirillum humi TaxID=1688639 RepID=A0A239FWT8_9BURK|nr:flagellar hook assembly protein FlgD [Noviherbaspirillum humi]SNS60968.1 flagellar basal-body rod modification protein FlgD [Noviherbaspirillum humi]